MKAEELVARGTGHFNAGRHEKALEDFRAALALGHDAADARYFTAHALLALGRAPEALEAFAELIERFPAHLAGYLDLADLLHRLGRLLDAAKIIRAALKREPGHEGARRRLAELETGQTGARETAPVATRARRAPSKRVGALISGRALTVPAALASGQTEMIFRLKGEPLKVPKLGNLPIEILALLAGVKPVIHLTARTSDLPGLEALRARLNLDLHVFSRTEGRGEPRLGVMLGKNSAALRAVAKRWDREDYNPGVPLGYPPCCTRWYRAHADEAGRDIVQSIYRHTKKKTKLPFALNDVFYFYSRVSSVQEGARRQKLVAMNPGLDLDLLNLISWHPCAYDCAASKKKAAKIWAAAKKHAPELASALKTILSRPVVFWDWSRFAVLDGNKVVAPYSLLEPRLIAKLEKTGMKEIGRLGGSPAPILLDFCS